MDGGEEKVLDPSENDALQRKGLVIRGWAMLVAIVLTGLAMTLPS